MIKKLKSAYTLSAVVALQFTLAGCVSLPDISSLNPFADDQETKSIRPELNFFDDEQASSGEDLQQELRDISMEWSEMRPAISRLIELESDLSFMLDQLSDPSSGPNFNLAQEDRSFPLDAVSLEQVPAVNEEPFNQAFSSVNDRQFITGTVENSNIVTRPISANTLNAVDGVSSEKFAGLDVGQSNSGPTQQTSMEVDPTKFSDKQTLAQNSNRNACNAYSEGGFSMHIASFKNRKSAENELRGIIKKLNTDTSCSFPGAIAEVVVNGTTFYSARVGNFESRALALQQCSMVKKHQDYCSVARYEGEVIL